MSATLFSFSLGSVLSLLLCPLTFSRGAGWVRRRSTPVGVCVPLLSLDWKNAQAEGTLLLSVHRTWRVPTSTGPTAGMDVCLRHCGCVGQVSPLGTNRLRSEPGRDCGNHLGALQGPRPQAVAVTRALRAPCTLPGWLSSAGGTRASFPFIYFSPIR